MSHFCGTTCTDSDFYESSARPPYCPASACRPRAATGGPQAATMPLRRSRLGASNSSRKIRVGNPGRALQSARLSRPPGGGAVTVRGHIVTVRPAVIWVPLTPSRSGSSGRAVAFQLRVSQSIGLTRRLAWQRRRRHWSQSAGATRTRRRAAEWRIARQGLSSLRLVRLAQARRGSLFSELILDNEI